MSKKIMTYMVVFVLCFSVMTTSFVGANQAKAKENVPGYQKQEQVLANAEKMYQFRERTAFQYKGNVTVDLDVSCDADNIGDQNISVEYRAMEQAQLQVKLNATSNMHQLQYRNMIQLSNGSTYQFRYMIICNLTRDTEDEMTTTLRLRIQERDRNSTWAFFNDATGEFDPVLSWYENGELVANTTHFTMFVVLSAPLESLEWYWYLVIGAGVIIVAVVVYKIYKKKKYCPDGSKKVNGKC